MSIFPLNVEVTILISRLLLVEDMINSVALFPYQKHRQLDEVVGVF